MGSRSASASNIQRVFRPLPLPSSITETGGGRCSTMAPAWRLRSRSSARVSPYSGSKVIASNNAVPSSSYKYIDGSSRWPTFPRLSLTATANSRIVSVCTVSERIILDLHAPKSGIDIGEVGPEPVAERSPQQSGVCSRGRTLEHIMVATKEPGRVAGIEGKGLESGKWLESRRRPLPSVADQLRNSECAVSQRGCRHGNRIPAVPAEVSPPAIRLLIAPRIGPFLFTMHRPVRGSMKLGFGGQSLAAPGCKGGRLFVGGIDWPIQWQRNVFPHASPVPLALMPPPEVRWFAAGANEFEILSIRNFVLAHGKRGDRHFMALEFVVPSKLIVAIAILVWLTQRDGAARNFHHDMNGRWAWWEW